MNYNACFSGQEGELATFVCRFLEEKGAIAEPGKKRVDLLLPGDLAQILGVEEFISIVAGSDVNMDSDANSAGMSGERTCYPIHFGSPLLEKVSAMAGSYPPIVALSLSFDYLKKGGFDALINQQFEFHKSKGAVSGTGEIKTRYLLLTCRYLAQSDEQKEGLVDLAVNVDTGAVVPGMMDSLSMAEKNYKKNLSQEFTQEKINRVIKLVDMYMSDGVEQTLSEFKKSMNRRFQRDAASLEAYYQALGQEMEESLDRSGLSDKLRQERREKIALIPAELAAKQQDLLNKYSIRVKVSPAAVMAISTPAVKVLFKAVSGRIKKDISFIYNPLTKQMDPLVCDICGQSMYRVGFTDDLRLACGACDQARK